MSDLDSCVGDIGATLDQQSGQVGEGAQARTILIVGAGPGGLFAACELLRHGVRPRIVERRLAPHREARGTALQPAVLERLERGGLIEPFLRAGVRIRHIQLLGLVRKLSNRLLIELYMGLQPSFHTIYCGSDRYRTDPREIFGGGALS